MLLRLPLRGRFRFTHHNALLFYFLYIESFLHELLHLKSLDLLLSLSKLISQASDLIPQQFVLSNNFLHILQILPGAPVLLVVLIGNEHLAVVAEETHPALGLQVV